MNKCELIQIDSHKNKRLNQLNAMNETFSN